MPKRKILAISFSMLILFMLSMSTPGASSPVWTPQATTSENNTLPTGLSLPDNITVNLTYQTTQPTGTLAPTARTGDGSEVTTKPTDSVAITARENDGSEVNTQPSGANNPNAQAVNASSTITEPDADVRPAEQTADSTIDNVKPTGAPTPNAQAITVTNQAPTDEPASLLAPASAAENNWYLGTYALSTRTGNVVVDDGSTAAFDNIYLDLDGDGTYAEDQSGDGRTVGSLVNENEDIYIENVRVADNFIIDGIYYKVSLASGFGSTDNTVFITSNTWCSGSWSVDTDNNGVLDSLYFVIVDNNSDDNFDMIVISFNNTDYGEGDLADGKVLAGNDENLWATGGDLTVGAYNFNLTTLAIQPEAGTNDAGIKMDTWYYNEPAAAEKVWIDNEGSGTLRELYYCIWDPDSDGIFENVALSMDDTNYGEGNLNNKILGPDDDESLDMNAADNKIQISV
ncbi:MAG: hypothetical protein QMD00_05190, partial [Hadesarchaea archaeon]|nr:hypothetical protein [Hadesarchaea archaeon]